MKVLSPAVTVLLVSHNKPLLREAITSVLGQTRGDIQILLVDSGQWIGRTDVRSQAMAAIYADFNAHPLIEWVTTGEGPDLWREKCPVGWATNETIRAGLIRGRYVCTFYDDDLYYPMFIERMAGFLDGHPEAGAVWCSQDRIKLDESGVPVKVAEITASSPKSSGWDCQVDGAQVMFRRQVLDVIGDPWLPESPGDTCQHSDGIFLETLGAACGAVPNIPEVLLAHRFTLVSTYTPAARV